MGTENTNLWREAFVLVSFDIEAAGPSTINDPWPSEFEDVGILVKGGPSESSAWGQNTDFFGRNGEHLDRYIDELAVTFTFATHEDNLVTRALRGFTGDVQYGVKPIECLVGFERRNQGRVDRQWTLGHALVVANGEITYAENAVTSVPFQATVFPDPDTVDADGAPAYWQHQSSATISS